MSKRKQPEESSTELVAVVDEVPVAGMVDESLGQTVVRGWTIGEGPTADEEKGSVPTVDLELEREEGWEVEAFWELLTRAGYVR